MAAQYPAAVYTPRTMVNRPGATYDITKTKIIFAEDWNKDRDEIVAIQNTLGVNPQGAYATVLAWLEALDSAIGGIVTTFLGLSDTPSSFTDQAGKTLIVNGAENALIFTPAGGGASAFLDLTDVPASYTDQAGKVVAVNATEDGLEFIAPGGGGATTEVLALVDPQLNISSVGDTYTDTIGNTYAETTNQTRVTLHATRQRQISMQLSGHVSAGTGSFELFNFTDSASLNTQTTTSTTEVSLSAGYSSAATNNNDAITIRVKNSGAGGTVTIDAGGMIEGDRCKALTATGHVEYGADYYGGGFVSSIKLAFIKTTSSATITSQLEYFIYSGSVINYLLFGTSFSEASIGSVITRNFTLKIPSQGKSSGTWGNYISAISGKFAIGIGVEIKADNI